MGSNTDDAIDRLFETTLQKFQQAVETSHKRGRRFIHESVALLYYYFMKLDMKRTESYISSPDWLRSKGATINPKNEINNNAFSMQ